MAEALSHLELLEQRNNSLEQALRVERERNQWLSSSQRHALSSRVHLLAIFEEAKVDHSDDDSDVGETSNTAAFINPADISDDEVEDVLESSYHTNPSQPTIKLPRHMKLNPPETFSGRQRESVDAWIFQVEDYMDFCQLDAALRVHYASTLFHDNARVWW